MKETFRKISASISNATGTASAFLLALLVIVVWGVSGPLFDFSDTWQLVINTGTTIVTFLMVFLIQNTQNRDSKSLHLKLDELIHSSKSARDSFVDLDNLTDEELHALDQEFKDLHGKTSVAAMHKLHKTIQAEKERRHSSAGQVIEKVLKSPLNLTNRPKPPENK